MLSVMLLFLALFISQELVIDFMKPLLWHFSIWLVFVADNAHVRIMGLQKQSKR